MRLRALFPALMGAILLLAAPALAQERRATRTLAYPLSGLTVHLPLDWAGAEAADEGRLPGSAHYRFANENPESALFGTVLRVEVVRGLNQARAQRWLSGRQLVGLREGYSLTPLANAPFSFRPGVSFQTTIGAGAAQQHGFAVYTKAGQTYYALLVEAPTATFAAQQAVLAALLGGVQIGG